MPSNKALKLRCAAVAGLVAGLAPHATTARADDLRAQFGLSRRPPPATQPSCDDGLAFHCAIATDPLDDATPYALSTWLPARYLLRLPVGDATHDAVAAYALGASSDEAGPVFGGASGVESRWTIDGAPADSVRTGAADTRIPLSFLDGILVRAGGFSARDRASTGGTIDARLRRGTAHHEVAADAWTQLTRAGTRRPIPDASYTVRRLSSDVGPRATASVVATGPLGRLLGGTAWYAAGIAPTLAATDHDWRASRLVDGNGDGLPDGLPGALALATIADTSERTLDYLVPVMARVGLDRDVHHLELSLIGHVQGDSRFLSNSTLQAAGVDRRTVTGDAIATWRGTWPATRARVQLSWHRSSRDESARAAAAADLPQRLTAYIPASLPDDPPLAAICSDGGPQDPTPLITNCPVPFGLFASGGAGPLSDVVADRPTVTGDLAHRIGAHVVRVGASLEDARLVTTSSFTGGAQERSLFVGESSQRRYYTGECSDTVSEPCDYSDRSRLTYRTVYAAAYAEDTFSPAEGISVDAGLRWELMWVGTRLHFSHEISPRVGITWDVLGGGRSRVWANLGKTFAVLPAGLGATVIQRDATAEDFDIFGERARVHDTGAAFGIEPGTEPIEQDELNVGAQVALAGALRVTLWGQGRVLRRGLETTPAGFGNPGRHGELPATRETALVALSLEMTQLERTAIRAGVMWGRTVGTWAGPFDPRNGLTLLQSPDWDGDSTNLEGALPTDPGGRAFFEAERRGALRGVGVAVATRLAVGSGRPRNVLAEGVDGVIHLLPRGADGRNPVVAQANVRLGASWRGTTLTLDVTNVFDRREVTNLDEVYTRDPVRPIQGGAKTDLLFLKSEAGTPAARRTAFQLPIAYQPPLSVTLGIHKVF